MRTGHSAFIACLAIACGAWTSVAAADDKRAPSSHLTLEAGAYCSLGKDIGSGAADSHVIGDDGCGGAARAAIGGRSALPFGFETWRLSARFSQDRDSAVLDRGGSIHTVGIRERRWVADVDVMRPLGFNVLFFKPDLLLGLRVAHHEIDLRDQEVALNGVVLLNGHIKPSFFGAGPRIGWTSRFAFNDTMRLDGETSISALFGRHTAMIHDVDGTGAVLESQTSHKRGVVLNYESTLALTFAPSGHAANGFEFSVGARSEYWFKQSWSDTLAPGDPNWTRDRNGITPFARARLPLQ